MRHEKCGKLTVPAANGARPWDIDPLADDTGGDLMVTRVGVVRVALVAAEAGARMQRDGLSTDPMDWMLAPRRLFGGRPAIEACMERKNCTAAMLLHGLGLGLDADPALIDALVAPEQVELSVG